MSKPKTFRPWLPEQAWLLPPSPIDWLPKDHLAFFLLDLIDQLDLDPILQLYRQKDARGEKAYDPQDDGCAASVRLLRRLAVVTKDRESLLRGPPLPGAER